MSTSIGPDAVSSGLVFCYDAGNAKSYSGSGTAVANLASAAYHGTLTNGVSFGQSSTGEFIFDGVDDYINVTSIPITFAGNTSSTVIYWLNVTATSANYGIVLSGAGPYNAGGIGLEIRYQGTSMECTIADGVSAGIRLQYASALTTGAWNQFCFTFDRDVLWGTLYKNGVQVATQSYSGEVVNNTSYGMVIGKGWDGYLNGKIASLSVYNRALSQDEVTLIYNSQKSRFRI